MLNFDHILSPAVRVGDLLLLSGQTPRDASGEVITGTIEEMTEYVERSSFCPSIQAECRQCIRNLEQVLKHAGGTLSDVAKFTSESALGKMFHDTESAVFLKDMDDFAAVNSVFERIVPHPKPARSCIQVARNPADVRIEIEAIARAHN